MPSIRRVISRLSSLTTTRATSSCTIGRQVDRARCQQLIELLDLGRVLLGRRTGPVDDRAALVHEALARLKRLLLVV
jgi:hypothetical protein